MSYCDRRIHRGTIYRAAGFECYRTNAYQIETWRLPLRPLTPQEDADVCRASAMCPRANRYRLARGCPQLALWSEP